MSRELLQDAVVNAGLSNALSMIDPEEFLQQLDEAHAQDAVSNGSLFRFLQAITQLNTVPATWQKLATIGWTDDEVAGLVEGNLLEEGETTLISAINRGALSLNEYNEFAAYPNQEVEVFFYTEGAQKLIAWMQEYVTLPKISSGAYGGHE